MSRAGDHITSEPGGVCVLDVLFLAKPTGLGCPLGGRFSAVRSAGLVGWAAMVDLFCLG